MKETWEDLLTPDELVILRQVRELEEHPGFTLYRRELQAQLDRMSETLQFAQSWEEYKYASGARDALAANLHPAESVEQALSANVFNRTSVADSDEDNQSAFI